MAEEPQDSGHPSGPHTPAERRLRPNPILRRTVTTQETVAIWCGTGLLALLIAVVMVGEAIPVHPIFPLAALVFFLHPFRRLIVPRRLTQLGIAVFLLWFSVSLSGVLFPFIAAFVIAYILSPLVGRLCARGLPRWVASLAVVLVILGLYSIVGVSIVPRLVEQGRELLTSAASLLQDTRSVLDRDRLVTWLTDMGIGRAQAEEIVVNTVEPPVRVVFAWIVRQVGDFARNATSLLEGLVNLILIPVLAFYFLNDFERVRRFVRGTILQGNPRYLALAHKIDAILNSYLRGIVTTSSIVGAAAVVILSILDIPYAGLLGILTGAFNLIPTLGMFLNLGVAMIVFLFADGDWARNTLIMAATIAGLHAVNAYLVEPRVIGQRVGLHPVILIASLFIFGHFLGFIGLVVAVPTTAVLQMLAREWYNRNSIPIPLQPPHQSPPGGRSEAS